MGLDQYLYLEIPNALSLERVDRYFDFEEGQAYVSGWDFAPPKEQALFQQLLEELDVKELITKESPHLHVFEDGGVRLCVAYWRKVNSLHRWFVENAQDGVDECQPSDPIDWEALARLKFLCQEAAAHPEKGEELLPTQSGFFFGNTSYDEWYVSDMTESADKLHHALLCVTSPRWAGKSVKLRYLSSW